MARAAARTVRGGFAETLTYTEFPPERWRRTRTDNGIERINREIRRRKRVVATFSDGNSVPMLVTTGLKYIVVHDWDKRRCLDMSKLEELDELKEKEEG
ncbi:MAG: transposase [Collinsella sp.]|nr:transposase [Collinsella sp.]